MFIRKLVNNKQNMIHDLIMSLVFLLSALSFQWSDTFTIGKIQINKILTGLIIFSITYFLVFDNFKKNSVFSLKVLFLIENFCLLFIGLGVIFQPFIDKNTTLYKFFEISNIIYYIIIVHSLIELYIDYLNKNLNPLRLKFTFYLSILCLSFFLLGKAYRPEEQISKLLSIFFAICFLIYFIRVIFYFINKKK